MVRRNFIKYLHQIFLLQYTLVVFRSEPKSVRWRKLGNNGSVLSALRPRPCQTSSLELPQIRGRPGPTACNHSSVPANNAG